MHKIGGNEPSKTHDNTREHNDYEQVEDGSFTGFLLRRLLGFLP
ncbi:MAG TPA: hypothetical protein VLX61_04105 [Anaerolineales bacterium]|nr:hypothetical protein [Anaerolineales bacterium]